MSCCRSYVRSYRPCRRFRCELVWLHPFLTTLFTLPAGEVVSPCWPPGFLYLMLSPLLPFHRPSASANPIHHVDFPIIPYSNWSTIYFPRPFPTLQEQVLPLYVSPRHMHVEIILWGSVQTTDSILGKLNTTLCDCSIISKCMSDQSVFYKLSLRHCRQN